MSHSLICTRSEAFTVRILKLYDLLARRGPQGRHIASELIRCAGSIGANANEAQDAQTKPDFVAKMSVSRKESRETLYWLRVAVAGELVSRAEVEWELNEAGELRAMIVAAIKTAQSNPSRGAKP
jgi:four helix bundle protein